MEEVVRQIKVFGTVLCILFTIGIFLVANGIFNINKNITYNSKKQIKVLKEIRDKLK